MAKSAISRPIWPRSGEDFVKSDYFSSKSCRESLDLVYLCRIWLFWSPKSAKSSWKLVGINGKFARIDVFGRVGFHGFWTRELETDPPASGFGTRDPRPTVGAVGSGERRSGTGGLGGWAGGLDSPKEDYWQQDSNLSILDETFEPYQLNQLSLMNFMPYVTLLDYHKRATLLGDVISINIIYSRLWGANWSHMFKLHWKGLGPISSLICTDCIRKGWSQYPIRG